MVSINAPRHSNPAYSEQPRGLRLLQQLTEQKTHEAFNELLHGRSRVVALVAPAGSGKTYSTQRCLKDLKAAGINARVLVPTHKNADEYKGHAVHDIGRSAKLPGFVHQASGMHADDKLVSLKEMRDFGKNSACTIIERAKKAGVEGISPSQHLCFKCSHFKSCDFQKHKYGTVMGAFIDHEPIIGTHASLPYPNVIMEGPEGPSRNIDPDVLIIDEDCLSSLQEAYSISSYIDDGLPPETAAILLLGGALPIRSCMDEKDIRNVADLILAVRTIRETPDAIVDDIIAKDQIDKARLALSKQFSAFTSNSTIMRRGSHADIDDALLKDGIRTLNSFKNLADMLSLACAANEAMQFGEFWASREDGPLDCLSFFKWKAPKISKSQKVLLLDATLDVNLMRDLFGCSPVIFDVKEARGERIMDFYDPNIEVTHLRHPATAASLETSVGGKASSLWRQIIDHSGIADDPGNWMIAAKKSVIKALPDECKPATAVNFGATRGVNSYADLQNILIVGQSMPGWRTVEMQAAAFSLQFKGRGIARVDPDDVQGLAPIDAEGYFAHPDPTANAFMQRHAAAECEQAAGRIRAMQKRQPAKVVIVSNFRQAWAARWTKARHRLTSRAHMPKIVARIADSIEAKGFAVLSAEALADRELAAADVKYRLRDLDLFCGKPKLIDDRNAAAFLLKSLKYLNLPDVADLRGISGGLYIVRLEKRLSL